MCERNPDDGNRCIAITFDDGYVDNLLAVDALLERGMKATWYVVTDSLGKQPTWPDDGRPNDRLLSPAELRELHKLGMEVGSHGMTHRRLTELPDEMLPCELNDSKIELEAVIGAPISSFAFPYGATDDRSLAILRESGYKNACTTMTGWALRDGDPFRIRRLTIFNRDTLGAFVRKLHFGSNDASWWALLSYAKRRFKP